LIPPYWLRAPKILSVKPGMHRWIWDLRYAHPASTQHEYPIAAVPHATPQYPLGPLALPGRYTVKLTANGRSYVAPITIEMDPRVKTSTADLQKQLALEFQLASAMTQSSQAVSQARSVREQLAKLIKSANGSLGDSVEALDRNISAILGGPPGSASASDQPALVAADSTVNALYKEVEKADAPPTTAQVEAFTRAESGLAAAIKRWHEVKGSELPTLNQQLRVAGLPELRLDLPPEQQAGGEDEE
jgi:hypothetical protein